MPGRVGVTWELQPGQSRRALERERRPCHRAAGIAGLRHQGDQRQHRAPAGGRGRVPLAAGRAALQPPGAARRQNRAAGAAPAPIARSAKIGQCPSAAAGARQPRASGRRRNTGRHDDEGHPGGVRLSVVGPFSRVAEAMVAAVHEDFDAGIIDVNLGGEFVYPVADVLVARDIPFVFVTGYGVESIESRFATCRSSRSRSSARCCRRYSFPRRVSPPPFKAAVGAGRSVARRRPASPEAGLAGPASRPRTRIGCIDFQL